LGGDMRALYPLFVEDTRAGLGRVQLMIVRGLGPERAFRLAARSVREVQGRGSVKVGTADRHARMSFRGSPLFTHPTWRVLQLFAICTTLELADTPGTATGEDAGPDSFVAVARW